ncbi:hypothetical protein ACELLULO517_26240 [Acidisoma cellulosilytica]|uniref:Uncharacterized protein n=1 Tax=Acidisoma cellulosilyticum TaxID=2802395 RepID=A0A963Z823_9PROT|nr:hypothetical protein [Acidisoma cellulosilyticum]MCB8883775.1 hypothetical protein [Acidisoma cellulosilyticum]
MTKTVCLFISDPRWFELPLLSSTIRRDNAGSAAGRSPGVSSVVSCYNREKVTKSNEPRQGGQMGNIDLETLGFVDRGGTLSDQVYLTDAA